MAGVILLSDNRSVEIYPRRVGSAWGGEKLGLTALEGRRPKERFCCARANGGARLSPPCEGGVRGGGPQNLRIVSEFAVRP